MTLPVHSDCVAGEVLVANKHRIVKASFKLAQRLNTEEGWTVHLDTFSLVSNYIRTREQKYLDELDRVWAEACQKFQACPECGGDLIVDIRGGGYGNDPADVAHVLICRECGRASDWQQVEVETGEELPI